MNALRINPEFRKKVVERIGNEELLMCYQCGKCTAHCPVFRESPELFNPRKVIEMAYLGIEDLIKSEILWNCTTCYECTENCPQMINFVDIIVTLRNIAFEEGYAPAPVVDELKNVIEKGFIYPATGRIKKIKEKYGLPERKDNGELKTLLEVEK